MKSNSQFNSVFVIIAYIMAVVLNKYLLTEFSAIYNGINYSREWTIDDLSRIKYSVVKLSYNLLRTLFVEIVEYRENCE